MRRDVFQAIADPVRRDIISRIAAEPLTVNAVAETFNISRQAVSKHIKILTECGLILLKPQGRERYCEAKLEGLQEVADWVEQYRKLWVHRFENLEQYLGTLKKQKKHGRKK